MVCVCGVVRAKVNTGALGCCLRERASAPVRVRVFGVPCRRVRPGTTAGLAPVARPSLRRLRLPARPFFAATS
jgi:hypothetical protein